MCASRSLIPLANPIFCNHSNSKHHRERLLPTYQGEKKFICFSCMPRGQNTCLPDVRWSGRFPNMLWRGEDENRASKRDSLAYEAEQKPVINANHSWLLEEKIMHFFKAQHFKCYVSLYPSKPHFIFAQATSVILLSNIFVSWWVLIVYRKLFCGMLIHEAARAKGRLNESTMDERQWRAIAAGSALSRFPGVHLALKCHRWSCHLIGHCAGGLKQDKHGATVMWPQSQHPLPLSWTAAVPGDSCNPCWNGASCTLLRKL